MYLFSKTEHAPQFGDRLRAIPILLLVGFGLSLNNSLAVVEGLFGRSVGTFVRTPKFNLGNYGTGFSNTTYHYKVSKMVVAELLLASYAVLSMVILIPRIGISIVPWLLTYALGNFYVAVLNILQTLQFAHPRRKQTVLASGH